MQKSMILKKVVLITTGQPSGNPRIVKEASALQAAGFDVTVLYCYFIDWGAKADLELLKKVAWKYELIGGSPGLKKIRYIYTLIRFKLARNLNAFLGTQWGIAERAQARAYTELLQAAKKHKADWYIGHNLGALPVAVKAAVVNNGKVGFDFEDYHRGENNAASQPELTRIAYLENKYVPHLNYISAASPLIEERIIHHFPLKKESIITLLNCFPLTQQPVFRDKMVNDNSLQLFWFSQTIGLNRGLEVLLLALEQMDDRQIHLTLAGKCNDDFKEFLEVHAGSIKDRIHFAGIIPPGELPGFASQFDVGLALELSTPENRNICLTNKVFTYILAGNAIILSASSMQNCFNDQFNIGLVFPINDINMLIAILEKYKDGGVIYKQRLHNYHLGKRFLNWDTESKKLLKVLNA